MYNGFDEEEKTEMNEWFKNALDNFGVDVDDIHEALFGNDSPDEFIMAIKGLDKEDAAKVIEELFETGIWEKEEEEKKGD